MAHCRLFSRVEVSREFLIYLRIGGTRKQVYDPAFGYIQIKINQRMHLAHRLAFLYELGLIPENVDHINHVRHDNSWGNLRAATVLDNCRNKSLSKRNQSGVNGVSYCSRRKALRARLKVARRDIHVGNFLDIESARSAVEAKKAEIGFHANHGAAFNSDPTKFASNGKEQGAWAVR